MKYTGATGLNGQTMGGRHWLLKELTSLSHPRARYSYPTPIFRIMEASPPQKKETTFALVLAWSMSGIAIIKVLTGGLSI